MHSVQEQTSSFSSTTKKSVQVIQSSGSDQQQQQQISQSQEKSTSKSVTGGQTQDLSSSNSVSSIVSDASTMRDVALFDDFVFRPTILNFDTMRSMSQNFEDVSKEVVQANDGQNFETKINVQGFEPNEIAVKVSDGLVTISAKQEQKSENNFSSRQFSKKFTLPNVRPENISCTFTKDGYLKISAPIERSQQQAITSGINSNLSDSCSSINSQATTATSIASNVSSKQHKQLSKTQEHQIHSQDSSRKSSLTSEVSSLRDFDEFVLRPRRIDLSSLMQDSNSQFQDLSKEICNVSNAEKFEMKLEVSNFKPEEVQVKITKNLIKIEGSHKSEFASRSFYKEFTIPYGVKADTIQCVMNDQGTLTISAPIQKQQQQQSLSSSTTTQQKQQISSTTSSNVQQQQVQQKKLQETGRTDSRESVTSNVSSIRETTKRLEDLFIKPSMNFDLDSILGARESLFEDVSKQVTHVNEGRKFEVKLDLSDYSHCVEKIQVKIANSMVIVEAKEETSHSLKQYYKKFSIPQGVKPEKITSSLSPSGILTISAPIEITSNTESQNQIVTSQQQHSTTTSTRSNQSQIQNQQQHSDSTSSIGSSVCSNRDLLLRPIMDLDSLLAKDANFEDISKEICQIQDGKKFETKLDVKDFKPAELEVKISKGMVTITGNKREEFSSKSFFKKFSIPAGVVPEQITSSLSQNGLLTISAPINLQQKQIVEANEQQSSTVTSSKKVSQTFSSSTTSSQQQQM